VTTFYGTVEHSIDERGRVAVPARYRPSFATGVILRLGPEGCIEMYTPEGFEAEKDLRLGVNRSTITQEGRRVRRALLANVADPDLDRQGRVLLPQNMRDAAGLDEKALIIGCGDYIEIWDPARWETELASVEREMRADGGLRVVAGDAG
jgi:MraZ protein